MFPVLRHASSHGLSILVCTIASALIIELMKPMLPNFMASLTKISTKAISILHLPLTVEYMNILLLATILAIIWGVFFKISVNRSER